MVDEMDDEQLLMVANGFGLLASTAFTLQYLPQAIYNWRRKGVRGFSADSIVFKHIGACFLFVNCVLIRERFPVTLYGFFNVLQHSIFLVQFTIYRQPLQLKYMLWICFLAVPFAMGSLWPSSIAYTNTVKPLCQIVSHLPQLRVCIQQRTTAGLSLLTQHLNIFGGLAGLLMCLMAPPASSLTYFLYINSILQAVSVYYLAIKYDGYVAFKIVPSSSSSSALHPPGSPPPGSPPLLPIIEKRS